MYKLQLAMYKLQLAMYKLQLTMYKLQLTITLSFIQIHDWYSTLAYNDWYI